MKKNLEIFARKLDQTMIHIAIHRGVHSKKKQEHRKNPREKAQAQHSQAWKHRERWIDPMSLIERDWTGLITGL